MDFFYYVLITYCFWYMHIKSLKKQLNIDFMYYFKCSSQFSLNTLTLFCRFLALKNLATVFLQQGCNFHENALRCYLQAVEIDSKDSVVWNQLGTLSCSMGLLSISRWAFEQGLVCSPNNCEFLSYKTHICVLC